MLIHLRSEDRISFTQSRVKLDGLTAPFRAVVSPGLIQEPVAGILELARELQSLVERDRLVEVQSTVVLALFFVGGRKVVFVVHALDYINLIGYV